MLSQDGTWHPLEDGLEMPESCPSCGRTMIEGADYCHWCGVARGSRGLTFFQYYKSLISRISPVAPREPGELNQAETDLRVKLATVSWWRTWSQLVNGLIKALPTVMVANTILLIVTLKTVSVTDNAYKSLVMVPEYTLAVFGALFVASLWVTRRIDIRLTRFGRQAQNQDADVKALRKTAIKKFTEYRESVMPPLRADQLRSDFIQPDGKVNRRIFASSWRNESTISRERQIDMDDIDHRLLVKMDGLVLLTVKFADEFDSFGEKCCAGLNQVIKNRGQVTASAPPAPLSYPIAIQALYRHFSDDIQNDNDIQWALQMQLIDQGGSAFLHSFFHGNPLDPKDFCSLSSRADLYELALKAKAAHDAARRQYEKVRIDLEAKTFLE